MAELVCKDPSRYVRMCAAEALGAVAAPGDRLAMDACEAATRDIEWLVAEAASAALAKLVNKGEQTLELLLRRSQAQLGIRDASVSVCVSFWWCVSVSHLCGVCVCNLWCVCVSVICGVCVRACNSWCVCVCNLCGVCVYIFCVVFVCVCVTCVVCVYVSD